METSTPKLQKHVRLNVRFCIAETPRKENDLYKISLEFDVAKESGMQNLKRPIFTFSTVIRRPLSRASDEYGCVL